MSTIEYIRLDISTQKICVAGEEKHGNHYFKVPPRLELGSLDSESRVLTITPWDPWQTLQAFIYTHLYAPRLTNVFWFIAFKTAAPQNVTDNT